MNDINKYLKSDLFAKELGIELLSVKEGKAKEISFNPKLATYLIDITKERGDIIALFQGTIL